MVDPIPGSEVGVRFNRLAERLFSETAHHSSVSIITANPNYQEIISLGPPVVLLMIDALRQNSGHWFYALASIVGEDHAVGAETVREASCRWIDWHDSLKEGAYDG